MIDTRLTLSNIFAMSNAATILVSCLLVQNLVPELQHHVACGQHRSETNHSYRLQLIPFHVLTEARLDDVSCKFTDT